MLFPRRAEPVRLGTGDVVFLPHGRGHTLADSPETPVSGRRDGGRVRIWAPLVAGTPARYRKEAHRMGAVPKDQTPD
ncbi:cupin domain-containing protein, partial [Streptomyces massasporeus]